MQFGFWFIKYLGFEEVTSKTLIKDSIMNKFLAIFVGLVAISNAQVLKYVVSPGAAGLYPGVLPSAYPGVIPSIVRSVLPPLAPAVIEAPAIVAAPAIAPVLPTVIPATELNDWTTYKVNLNLLQLLPKFFISIQN